MWNEKIAGVPEWHALKVSLRVALFLAMLTTSSLLMGGGPVAVTVEDFSSKASFDATWKIKKWAGTVQMVFLKDGERSFVQLLCDRSSWAFIHQAEVDLAATPILAWSWRVNQIPKGSDGRVNETDDEAAQIYVFFPGKGLLGNLNNRIVGYTWEDVPPAGTFYTSPKNDNTKVWVLHDGKDRLGVWHEETRDVAADFQKAFGEPAPKPLAVCFQIDSDDTKSNAQSDFGPISFRGR